jgi:hypothetical protein
MDTSAPSIGLKIERAYVSCKRRRAHSEHSSTERLNFTVTVERPRRRAEERRVAALHARRRVGSAVCVACA